MTQGLAHLLNHPIDFAGLFPPAKMTMAEAVPAYLGWLSSDAAWLVDRFVCPASQLDEFAEELAKHGYHPDQDRSIDTTLIGTAITNGAEAKAILKADLEPIRKHGAILPTAFEIKVPTGEDLKATTAALAGFDFVDMGLDLYVEVGWDGEWQQAMHDVAAAVEDVGFKARTGGLTADAFPDSDKLAEFIITSLSLDAPFKFTAGLHEPLRYFDPLDGAYHHGFVNAMVASAVALMEDLSQAEIVAILNIENASAFEFSEEGVSVMNWNLDHEDLDDFWNFFGGFGSCSVQEPLDGLRRHGWLR